MRVLDADAAKQLYIDALDFAHSHNNSTYKVEVIGFCWGGSMAPGRMTAYANHIDAAVVYYGGRPTDEELTVINAPTMMHYVEKIKINWICFLSMKST